MSNQLTNQPTNQLPNQSARRSLLFMPGDSLRKMEKATTLPVDTVILDLEDAVAYDRKDAARQSIHQALLTLDFGPRERLVRINDLETDWWAADLAATVAARPDGYVVAKVESAGQLRQVDEQLTQAERQHGWPQNGLALLAMIETARGILHLPEIAAATPRLQALIFGAEDFAASIGALRTRSNTEVLYARSALVTASAAYDCQSIDMIFADFHDDAGLEEECQLGRQLGFVGKTAIHPNQLAIINRSFAPSPTEIAQAQRLAQTFHEQQAAGFGAFSLAGKMVDRPMLRAAERILARARAAGLI
jgi:citrate lyase beta subunit